MLRLEVRKNRESLVKITHRRKREDEEIWVLCLELVLSVCWSRLGEKGNGGGDHGGGGDGGEGGGGGVEKQ